LTPLSTTFHHVHREVYKDTVLYISKPNLVCAQEHTADNPHNNTCTLSHLMQPRARRFYRDF